MLECDELAMSCIREDMRCAMIETLREDTADGLLRAQEVAAWLTDSKSTLVRWRQSLERAYGSRRAGGLHK